MKTNRGAAKRLRVTGSGKIMHRKAWGAHLFKSKSRDRQMRLKGNAEVSKADRREARRLLGT
jgi:large subunit ribosomal protein L35